MPIIVTPAIVTVPYEELEGSPTAEFTKEGFNATRILKCAWGQNLLLGQQLKGKITRTGGVINRVLPDRYPSSDVWAHVASVGIEPLDDDRPMPEGGDLTKATYEYARLTLRYSHDVVDQNDTGDTDEDVLIEERISPWVEFLTLPPDGFRWKNASGPVLKEEEAPAKKFSGFTWHYSMTFVPSVPAAVADLVGKVNSDSLTSRKLGFVFPAETLLYNPPDLHRVTTTEGEKMWSLAYFFQYRKEGWNRFWRQDAPAGDKWQRIVKSDGTAADPYEQGDFTALITI